MISVTVLAKNSQKTLFETLQSLTSFPEVLLYDTGSTDRTIEIAREFPNVRIVEAPFEGFGKTHNKASATAKHDWILSIDSDEIITKELAQTIHSLKLDPTSIYRFPRHNYFNGKWVKWCSGWHPDRVTRLYHRGHTRFNEAEVHEKILRENVRVVDLPSPLLHTPFHSIEDFVRKMQAYSTLFAEQQHGKKSVSLLHALLRSSYAFFKSYILKRGFLGGKEGLIISFYNSHTTLYKYLKLIEKDAT